MKSLGYQRIALKSIHVDAVDIRKRTKAAHVAELAADIRARGDEPIHALSVRADTKGLLAGRDRFAALETLKVKKTWVHMYDVTDAEAKDLELAENAYRRQDDRTALIAEMVARRTAALTQSDASGDNVPASEQTIKARARRQVARAAGISPAAVKKAEQRAAAKDHGTGDRSTVALEGGNNGGASVPPAGEQVAVSIDLLGVDEPHTRYAAEQAAADQQAIDAADQLLRQAQAAIGRATACTPHQEIKAEINRVAGRVRARRPAAICPWCKALPQEAIGGPCAPCGGLGYVPEEIRDRAPKELVGVVDPHVAINGKFYPYAGVRDAKAPPKNGAVKKAGKAKHVTVELPDGRVIDPMTVDTDDQAY